MLLFHGEDTAKSRQSLLQSIETLKSKGLKIEWLAGKKITEADLELAFGTDSLFADGRALIVEELHSLPHSKKRTQLIQQLANLAQKYSDMEVLLWEKKTLTPTQIKNIAAQKVSHFKLSSVMFAWLDALSPQPATKKQQLRLLHEVLASEDEHVCFSLLIRQVRLLIQIKDGGHPAGAPFMITKLRKQANNFTVEQLLKAHRWLLQCDVKLKTSRTTIPLGQQLGFFITTL